MLLVVRYSTQNLKSFVVPLMTPYWLSWRKRWKLPLSRYVSVVLALVLTAVI